MTKEEKDRIVDMWLNRPCTFDEIVADINQFKETPIPVEEIEKVIDENF